MKTGAARQPRQMRQSTESRSIDLHNRTVPEAIREFVGFYNSCVSSGYRGRIEVIHGYGSNGVGGAIRQELRKFLAAHTDTFGEYLAGESLRNPGVTVLYAKEPLSATTRGLESMPRLNPAQEAIRKLCVSPQAKERILFKLRARFGDRALSDAIQIMVRSHALEMVRGSDGVIQFKARKGPGSR